MPRPVLLRISTVVLLWGALAGSAEVLAGEAEWRELMQAGNVAYRRGDFAAAAERYAAALKEAESLPDSGQAVAAAINNLAIIYRRQGRLTEAEEAFRRGLAMLEKALGPGHPHVASLCNNLADLYRFQGRHADAKPLYLRALAVYEKDLGPEHPNVAIAFNNLALLATALGHHAEAERLYRKSLAIREKALGQEHPDVALVLTNLAGLLQTLARFDEAELLYRRAIAISEKALGTEHPQVATALNNLAGLYLAQGRLAEAAPLHIRSFALMEKSLGTEHPDVALAKVRLLGPLYRAQGRNAEAEELHRRALASVEKAYGKEHPFVALALNQLGVLLARLDRQGEALPLLERALAIREKLFGADHLEVAIVLNNLANCDMALGRHAEAEGRYRRAIASMEKALGREHPDVAHGLGNLAYFYYERGRWAEGLEVARRAARTFAARSFLPDDAASQARLSELRTRSGLFVLQVSFLYQARSATAAAESFEAAQLAYASDIAEQVDKMAARFSSGSSALSQLTRERQDQQARIRQLDLALMRALGRPPAGRDAAAEKRLNDERASIRAELSRLDSRLAAEFPRYRELTDPQPLKLSETQKLLGPEEALVMFLVARDESFVWIVRRDAAVFERLALPRRELDVSVRALRAQLDLGAADLGEVLGKPFDVQAAHALYRKLLAPGDQLLADVRQLIVVADGALTSLPLAVLVTDAPPRLPANSGDHAEMAWLARKFAMSSLPSPAALRALRLVARDAPGTEPFLGFGDPQLGGGKDDRRRALAGLYARGAVADPAEVRKLAPLPETAAELRAIAALLKAPVSQVKLGTEATERFVKEADLARYRTVAFATHGLMAGDFRGLAEPALVLTPPGTGTELDDGLLTASEIAGLRLNADWVILSACNTAAPDGTPGAEGLSGLARAFFYAGARSLLVSHWAVSSDATVALMTNMFEERAKGASKSEALRRSMLALMKTPGHPEYSHPAFWAPFTVVGEGGR